jgi:hypothetical protein
MGGKEHSSALTFVEQLLERLLEGLKQGPNTGQERRLARLALPSTTRETAPGLA